MSTKIRFEKDQDNAPAKHADVDHGAVGSEKEDNLNLGLVQQGSDVSEEMKLDDARRVKAVSPGLLVVKRFFRNKLALVGLSILVILFLFCFLGAAVYPYRQDQTFSTFESILFDYSFAKQNENDFTPIETEDCIASKDLRRYRIKSLVNEMLRSGANVLDVVDEKDDNRMYKLIKHNDTLFELRLNDNVVNTSFVEKEDVGSYSNKLPYSVELSFTDDVLKEQLLQSIRDNQRRPNPVVYNGNTYSFVSSKDSGNKIVCTYADMVEMGRLEGFDEATVNEARTHLGESFVANGVEYSVTAYDDGVNKGYVVTNFVESTSLYATTLNFDRFDLDVSEDSVKANRVAVLTAIAGYDPADPATHQFNMGGKSYSIAYDGGAFTIVSPVTATVDDATPRTSEIEVELALTDEQIAAGEQAQTETKSYTYKVEDYAQGTFFFNLAAATAIDGFDEADASTHIYEQDEYIYSLRKEGDLVVFKCESVGYLYCSNVAIRRYTGKDTISVSTKAAFREVMDKMKAERLTQYETKVTMEELDANGEVVKDENGRVKYKEEYFKIETEDKGSGRQFVFNNYQSKMLPDINAAPSKAHILGTDGNAMDVMARIMYGGRISLLIGFIVVFIEIILGSIMGGISGYFGGIVDNIIMRIVDIFYCIPTMPILIILGAMFNTLKVDNTLRVVYMMMILGFLGWPGIARLVRGQILSLREQDFMIAAEASGLTAKRKIARHLIPNVIPQLIVQATMGLGGVILLESTLSFLGLGVKFPIATWGQIINSVSTINAMQTYTYIWIPVGGLICLAVIAFNFVGDGLRDAFDPKMSR